MGFLPDGIQLMDIFPDGLFSVHQVVNSTNISVTMLLI